MRIVVHGGEPASLILFRYDLMKALRTAGHDVLAAAPGVSGDVATKLAEIGVETISTRFARTSISPLSDLQSLLSFAWQLRNLKPDLILSYTIKPVIFGTLAAWLAGVPRRAALVTGLGYALSDDASRGMRLLARCLYRLALGRAHTVILQNPDDQRYFIETGLAPARNCHLVNGSGINLLHFQRAPMPPSVSFLLIARLLNAKGISDYLSAARIVKKSRPEVTFHLVGPRDPSPDRVPDGLVESAVADGSLIYHGATDDVRPYIKNCSVYVFPSFYGEGTPRSVLEALAMARPAIVTDVAGCRETVINEKTGILVAPHNPQMLAAAMMRFVENPQLAEKMGNAAWSFVAEKYDIDLVNKQMFTALGL